MDWKEHYAAVLEDHNAGRYSQHAAAFVLTLLPNLKVLTLPRWWKPAEDPTRLVDSVAHGARKAQPLYHRPSMAQVTEVQEDIVQAFDLDWAFSFIALPNIRRLCLPDCVSTKSGNSNITPKHLHCASTLSIEEIRLGGGAYR